MKTVGKNTKEYALVKNKMAVGNGVNVKRFDLRNGFKAVIQNSIAEMDFKIGRLTKKDGVYTLQVHSNLWYVFAND